MSMKDRLLSDMKQAMKDKDVVRKNTIQLVRASVLQEEKDKKIVLDEEGVLDVIARELKKRRDVLPQYEKSQRDDLVRELQAEIAVLLEYLPQQLSVEELQNIIQSSIAKTNATSMKDMGALMAEIMPQIKGRADGKLVNQMVRDYLS